MQNNGFSYVAPILIAIALVCAAAAGAYQLVHMHMNNFPCAVVTLDTGAKSGETQASLGEIFAEQITSSESLSDGEGLIRWNTLTTKESFESAKEQSKYYGTIVFPEDYTELAIAQAYAEDDIDGLKVRVEKSGAAKEKVDSTLTVIDETARIYNRAKRAKRLEIFKAECAKAGHDENAVNAAAGTANVDLGHASDENFQVVALALGMQLDTKILDVPNIDMVLDVLSKPKDNTAGEEGQDDQEELDGFGNLISITYDYGKNPLVSGVLKGTLESRLDNIGMKADVSYEHAGTVSTASIPGPFSALASSQVLVMVLVIGAFACGILMARAFAVHRSSKLAKRFARCLIMLFYALALSALVAGGVYLVAHFVCGVESPSLMNWFAYMWIAAFALCIFASGLATMSVGLSAFLCTIIAVLGAFAGTMPPECMPDMWATWLCPVLPQMPIGEGIRQVLYYGSSFVQIPNLTILGIYAAVGAVIGFIMMLIPAKKVVDEITITEEELRWEAGEGAVS